MSVSKATGEEGSRRKAEEREWEEGRGKRGSATRFARLPFRSRTMMYVVAFMPADSPAMIIRSSGNRFTSLTSVASRSRRRPEANDPKSKNGMHSSTMALGRQ
jgi:hypothetical protein